MRRTEQGFEFAVRPLGAQLPRDGRIPIGIVAFGVGVGVESKSDAGDPWPVGQGFGQLFDYLPLPHGLQIGHDHDVGVGVFGNSKRDGKYR
jgi:hypothetical protein